MDGWPSGYGASFRISFQSLVFGRGFEPHSIQNLGASVLPVLAVFPFLCSSAPVSSLPFSQTGMLRCHQPGILHDLKHHALHMVRLESSNFCGLELQNILPNSGFSPRGFRHLARFLIVLPCQLPI